MSSYRIKIISISDILVGLGEGYGTIIDSDVVIDDIGLPYIPSKRIKGIMRESAEELNEMLYYFGKTIDIDGIFGSAGAKNGELHLSNFFINDYKESKEWFEYLINAPNIINRQVITEQITSFRYSTAIDSLRGFAKEHSLRTKRVIDKGIIFTADAEFSDDYESDLALVCQNIRRMGTNRTRGLGSIEVHLTKNGKDLNNLAIKMLEKGVNSEGN